ncbi:MAG TPA: 2OG-Fe(II) oxygenase [Rhodanobacteraceae bacterium]|nr:2OG-Fe(II) oxygenase [Rhodanobacteraceae bacterium]
MENPDFIEVYDGAVDASACADLIARFEASGKLSRGATGSGVNTALKDSWDICVSDHAEWRDAEGVLNRAMLRGLMAYVRRHAFLAIAPMQLSRKDPGTGNLVPLDADAVTSMPDAELKALVMKVFRPGKINIQRYFADQGGYPYWHSELFPKQGDDETLHRVLLWTIYLNDAFEEGETEFHYQRRRIVPRTGSLLFAPAGFTHTHRGNRPKGGNKYIATSWVLFERAERLYAVPPAPK